MPEIQGPGAGPPPAGRPLRDALILLGLCLVVYLPGFFTIPPVDRDESRFAQASRQMFESVALPAGQRADAMHSGGLLVPMIQDRARLNKPPLIYWLQAGSAAVFTGGDPLRDEIWMYRVPSLLAAIAAVLLTWRIGASMFGARVAVLAGAMLAVCPVVAWETHQARADMVLLALTTGTMGALWRVYERREIGGTTRAAAAFWVVMALGILTKGPIAPMVAGLAVLMLCVSTRDWSWVRGLRPVAGATLCAAIVVPWFVLVARRVGVDLYVRTVLDETLGRSLAPKEGHWAPPGYHLVLLPVLFWPGSLLTAVGLGQAARRAFPGLCRRRAPAGAGETDVPHSVEPLVYSPWASSSRARLGWIRDGQPSPQLFLLAWIVPAWIVFEIVGTKLPHYTMPLYPAVAILSAWAVATASTRVWGDIKSNAARAGFVVWFVIGGVLVLGGAGLSVLFRGALAEDCALSGAIAILAIPAVLATAAIICFAAASICLLLGGLRRAQRWAIAAWAASGSLVLMALCPVFAPGADTPHLARSIIEQPGWQARPIGSEYHEDSLIYALRGHVERIDDGTAQDWLTKHRSGIAIVHDRFRVTSHWWRDDTRYNELGSAGIGGFDVVPNYHVVEQLPVPKEPPF